MIVLFTLVCRPAPAAAVDRRPLSHIIQSCDPHTNLLVPLRATSDSHSQLWTELDYNKFMTAVRVQDAPMEHDAALLVGVDEDEDEVLCRSLVEILATP